MCSKKWIIFASVLLVSARANHYNQVPQKFYDVSFDSETSEQNENKEVIVYLTPEQVKALEAGGAEEQPTEDAEDENDEDNPDLPVPPVTEDQEEDEESEDVQQEEQAQQEEESPEDDLSQDIDFEAILRLLNEEQVEEEGTVEEQARNEPQNQEESTETLRSFSPKVTLKPQLQKEQKNVTPSAAKREQILKTYSYIRYQPNEQPQRINIQLLQGDNEPIVAQQSNQELEAPPAPAQERRKYKLVPVEVEQTSEEPIEEENAQQQISEPEAVAPATNKNKPLRGELLNILRELRASNKFNNQKYAIEIEKLKNLQNDKTDEQAAEKAAEIAKTAPLLIQQQLNKKRLLNKNKQGKAAAVDPKQAKGQQLKVQKNSALESQNPMTFPVLNVENLESQKPIPVPVEIPKVLSVKNVYVKTRTDKPYIVSRRVPENNQQRPLETPKGKPERITILRHIWEQ